MARRPSSSREHARRGDAGELARVRGMAALTEGRRRLVGDRSAVVSFRKKSDVRWLACRGCHGAGDDDLVGNLRSKAPTMSSALGRSGQRRGNMSECRSRGGVDEQRRERERCCAATTTSPFFSDSGGSDLAQQRARVCGRQCSELREVGRGGWGRMASNRRHRAQLGFLYGGVSSV
jgi:hypothetical protein